MKSEDEFDDLDYPELTNEEWALVDTQVVSALQAFNLTSREAKGTPPSIPPPPRYRSYTNTRASRPKNPHKMQAARAAAHGLQRLDLFSTFRPAGSLSVSDLVGPVWCEVKFDYNLRWGRRWERVEQKPEVLVTSKGKRIEVRKSEARKGEVIKDAGVAIHKKLEKVLSPVEIEIPISTKEERWGSKLLSMLASVQLLRTVGYCREFPVMGFIGEILVVGVIDEIVRKPRKLDDSRPATQVDSSARPTGVSGTMPRSLYGQTAIPQYFLATKSHDQLKENTKGRPRSFDDIPEYSLHLIDHKSRNSRSPPSMRDQHQSRLQLMLYKHLLSALLGPSSFLDIMSRLHIKTSAPFSPAFLQTQEYLCASNELGESVRSAMCLGDLMIAWGESLKSLDIGWGLPINESGSVTDELELVYRLRETPSTSRRKRRSVSREPSSTNVAGITTREHNLSPDAGVRSPMGEGLQKQPSIEYFDQDWEDAALAWAIQESLKAAEQNAAVFGPALESTAIPLLETTSIAQGHEGAAESPSLPTPSEEGQAVPNHLPTSDDPTLTNLKDKQIDRTSSSTGIIRDETGLAPIVAISRFSYDEQELTEYIADVIKFWRGQREPRGVDIEDANRCNSCEFRDGCEWREAKAAQFDKRYTKAADL